jgi:putative membrane protein
VCWIARNRFPEVMLKARLNSERSVSMKRVVHGAAMAVVIGVYTSHAWAALSTADKTFVNEAASGGEVEVQLGQLAQQKASSSQVKAFGQRMIEDHTKANQELKSIATAQNLELPTKPGKSELTTEHRLKQASGPAFDRAYIEDMVQDHEKDVAAFRKEAQSGQDPAVKAFAQKYLPVLEQHLRMAQELNKG